MEEEPPNERINALDHAGALGRTQTVDDFQGEAIGAGCEFLERRGRIGLATRRVSIHRLSFKIDIYDSIGPIPFLLIPSEPSERNAFAKGPSTRVR